MSSPKFIMAQAALLQQYAIDIKQASLAKSIDDQQAWYTKACLIANQLKTLTVKEVYINIETKLEEIESSVLSPARSPKQDKEVNKNGN